MKRLATATALLSMLMAALVLLPPRSWTLVCLALTAGCAYEWAKLSSSSNAKSALYSALASVVFLAALEYATELFLLASVAFWLTLAPLFLKRPTIMASSNVILPLGLVILPAAGIAMVDLRALGTQLILGCLALIWISDSSAYFAGRRYGYHKLAPSISPGKSWEGVFAALVSVAIYSLAISHFFPEALPMRIQSMSFKLPIAVILGLALCVSGIVGDLLESALKRNAGVKDSGQLLPGHGGLLDRADAMLAALPMIAVLYRL